METARAPAGLRDVISLPLAPGPYALLRQVFSYPHRLRYNGMTTQSRNVRPRQIDFALRST